MKILTWNINGIRAVSSKRERSLKDLLDSLEADVICFQETKVTRDMLDNVIAIVEGYNAYFSFSKLKTGYSGVATFCRNTVTPINAEEGLSPVLTPEPSIGCHGNNSDISAEELEALDAEGRAILTEHKLPNEKFVVIINVYCPRADKENEERVSYKMKFYKLLQDRAEMLVKTGRHVIVLGDINTAHKMIDHCEPDEQELFDAHRGRQWLNQFLVSSHDSTKTPSTDELATAGLFNDTFRYFHPTQTEAYTNWCTVTSARLTNYGTRIDYIFADTDLVRKEFVDCVIRPDIEGSDHCPVIATLKSCFKPASKPPPLCTRYMPEFAGRQQNLKSYFLKQTNHEKQVKPDTTSKNIFHEESATLMKEEPKSTSLDNLQDGKASVKRGSVFDEIRSVKRLKNARKTNPTEKTSSILSFFSKPPQSSKMESLYTEESFDSQEVSSSSSSSSSRDQDFDQSTDSQISLTSSSSASTGGNVSNSLNLPIKTSCKPVKETRKADIAQWKNILRGPRPAPLCRGHGEPCVLRTVKIKGPNHGRQFYCCARPQGHSSNRQARCNFFQWVK